MREEDKIPLEINDYLRKKFNELSKEVGPYSNIIGIFYHELMIYLTNYVIIRDSDAEFNQNISFPYLNLKYVQAPFLLKHNLNIPLGISYKTKLLLILVKCNNLIIQAMGIKKELTILSPYYFFIRQVLSSPFKYKINILKNSKCYLKKYHFQMTFLSNILKDLSQSLKIPNHSIFTENFLKYCEKYVTTKKQFIKSDYLIVESPSNIFNRINCAFFLENGKRTISFSHGSNSFTSFDEPIIGYGELSYCTYYVDYGSEKRFENYKHIDSLHTKPKILYRSADSIHSIYKSPVVAHCKILKNTKIAYLPNSFNNNITYGPFRDICDLTYTRWQNALSNLDLDITYKVHPIDLKNKTPHKFKQVSTENICDFVKKYDIFILDFFGTVYAYACATNKPIIYFNLGQRNMSSEFLRRFKKRVYWVDIDLNLSFDKQIQDSMENFNALKEDFINKVTINESLNNCSTKEVLNLILSE